LMLSTSSSRFTTSSLTGPLQSDFCRLGDGAWGAAGGVGTTSTSSSRGRLIPDDDGVSGADDAGGGVAFATGDAFTAGTAFAFAALVFGDLGVRGDGALVGAGLMAIAVVAGVVACAGDGWAPAETDGLRRVGGGG
jgi:hypothetical protein